MESAPQSHRGSPAEMRNPDGTLVLVVHGIGDPVPGQIVRAFATCLAHQYPNQEMDAVEESVWIPIRDHEPDGKHDLLEPLAAHVQRGAIAGERVIFSEVYWADLSLVRKSLWGVLTAIFEILFGLPHVVRESLRIPPDPPIASRLPKCRMQILGAICNLAANILLGPVAALNGLLILLLVTTVGMHALVGNTERDVANKMEDSHSGQIQETLPTSNGAAQNATPAFTAEDIGAWMAPALLVVIALVIYFRRLYRKGRWQQFWKWTMWCAGFFVVLTFLAASMKTWPPEWAKPLCGEGTPRNVLEMIFCLDGPRGFLWLGAVVVFALVLALLTNSVLMILALFVWLSAFLLRRKNQFPWFRYPLHVGFLATGMMMGLWSLLIPLLWQFGLLKLLDAMPPHVHHLDADLRRLHGNGLPLMVAYTLFAVLLGLCIWLVWLWRWTWSLKFGEGKLKPEGYGVETGHPPRLIAHAGIVWTAALLTCVGSALFLLAFVIVFLPGTLNEDWLNEPFVKYLVAGERGSVLAENLTLAIITLMGVFGSFLLPQLVNGADILLDVINHFRRDPSQTSCKRPALGDYWIREAIYDRFYQVLREMLRRERPRRLCIISHSQGTVIAIDNLNSLRINRLLEEARVECVDLVTMGSPFEHLYQYYFPASYPTLERKFARWEILQSRIARWVNIFRVDDFVGTHILDPDDPTRKAQSEANQSLTAGYWTASNTKHVENHPVRPRGHNDYWTDLPVLKVLRGLELFPGPLPVAHEARTPGEETP